MKVIGGADPTGTPKAGLVKATKDLTVAKKPLGNIPAERRAEIANEVLAGYLEGKQVVDMAQKYQTSDVTIYALLLREYEDDWKDIQKARALARLERCQDILERAPDALSLARARESVRSAQWELERLLRRLYGDTPVAAVQVNINLNDIREEIRTLEAELGLGKAEVVSATLTS